MGGAAGAAFALAAAAGAFGFAPFFAAKAPEVETARIARPTTMIFVILNSLDGKDAPTNSAIAKEFHVEEPKPDPCRGKKRPTEAALPQEIRGTRHEGDHPRH